MSIDRLLYRLARFVGDVRAVGKGPVAVGKRLARRQAYRTSGRITRRLLRTIGL